MVVLYGSVITGFEKVSGDEVTSTLRTDSLTVGRGFIKFELDPRRIPKDALNRIRNEISRINWKTAVECWEIAHNKQVPGGVDEVKEQMEEYVKTGVSGFNPRSLFTFRVTCHRAGDKKCHSFSSMEAASALGAEINKVFGWRPDMKNFDMEVLLNVRNNSILVMVALNRESLFKRNICAFGPTTMRPTMCYCMTALAQPSQGDIILDPMCGGGSIPLEAALSFDGCLFIGADVHPKAMKRCNENMKSCDQQLLNSGSELAFICCNSLRLPFSTNSINSIVTDLPFGRKIGSINKNRVLYPSLLAEWERVVKPGGRLVIMTHDKRNWERALALNGGNWRTTWNRLVNIGGLQALCSCLINTKKNL
ncbi:THUMP domain protein [Dictyocaulus viviparus]|uniref:THUMP domain protein n=1 Tax=Dictyocaulus viviparus TaxID=29172 RepID=A0A0D8XP88_DICVI|nr:THUMP domain protein [Dictyocaulus viviparus]